MGGDLLTIETACVPGKGKLTYTGSLGEVMQESIQAALTVVRSRADKLGINSDFYENVIFTFTFRKGDAERRSERRYRDVYRAGLLSDGESGTR